MSKEQKCKCCQDYWYTSNLTNELCPNCYDYVADLEAKLTESERFMQECGLKDLEELDNYIQKIHSHYDEVKNKGTCGLCEKIDNEQIAQLKQQLAEKEKELANAVVFPKLEKDNAHKGAWYLYFLDDAGNISYQHFYASKKEAVNELEKRGSYTKQPNQDKISFAIEQINILVNMITDRSELIKINKNEMCVMFDVYDLNMCSQELIRQLKEGE